MGASVNRKDADCRASGMMLLCVFLVLLCQICQVPAVSNTSGINQDKGVITAQVGENVTISCFCRDESTTFLSWYQQSLGGKPLLISNWLKSQNKEASLVPTKKERFQIMARGGQECINHLIIKNVQLSDSATYYCGILEFNAIVFGQGTFLHVKASHSSINAHVDQPTLEPLRSGDSVNLNCTVYAEPCAGEQNFYWFRHGAAQPAIVYHSVGKCKSVSGEEPHMENCTLSLALKSVSPPDAGMYYCALASCGEIVFGSGTRVEIVGGTRVPPLLVYCLIVALAVSIILLLVFAFIMYKMKKKLCSICKGTVSPLAFSAASDVMSQDADALHYAALSLKRTSERHRQEDNVESVCVYSRVKSRKE